MLLQLLQGPQEKKRLWTKIDGSSFEQLKSAAAEIEAFNRKYRNKKWFYELAEIFVAKVLLLTPGVDGVLEIINTIRHRILRQRLLRAYAFRTTDPASLVYLAGKVWSQPRQKLREFFNNPFQDDELFSELTSEQILTARNRELLADKKFPFGMTYLKHLASQIQDSATNGTNSLIAEEILIDMAMPELANAEQAADLAAAFGSKSGCHQLLESYLEQKGIDSFSDALFLANAINGPESGGREVAQAILSQTKKKNILLISSELERLLNKLATQYLVDDCLDCEFMHDCDLPQAMAARDMIENDLWEAVEITGETERDQQEHFHRTLEQAIANGIIHQVDVNNMPIEMFFLIHGDDLPEKTRVMLEEALKS